MALTIDPGLKQVDILEIKRMIPHRYPFLLIDRVVNVVPSTSGVGIKNVTANEPHFEGHFPVRPVMPGVLIVEAMAQTAAVLVVSGLPAVDDGTLVYFMSIETAKFRHTVTPGDRLELHVSVMRGRGKVWKFRGEGFVGDKLAAEAEFTAMIMSPDDRRAGGSA
jgi:3-hydroxyacyl-[acyl-carrier-protein] dehydratase